MLQSRTSPSASYVGRVLRLTLRAPDIVEATLMAALCMVDFRRLGHIVRLKAPFTEGVLR
jgi:hypothetical protein